MPLLKIKYFDTIILMTERISIKSKRVDVLISADDITPPDRSSSIDPRHTFARGGKDNPNSGPEYNPVLEISVSLPGAELHEEPGARETRT